MLLGWIKCCDIGDSWMNAETQMLTLFEKKRVMIIVPHEDDEINVAGSLLAQFKNRVVCDVVYLTNGELFISGKRRQREAKRALKLFGVGQANVFFLGYPDVSDLKNGSAYKTDKNSCVKSIEKLILERKPDFIIANDMDSHPNHKELSVLIETAILKVIVEDEEEKYYPILFKTFAYDLAFYAPEDYLIYNLKSTVNSGKNTYFDWNQRLRLPVLKKARTKILARNIIFRGMWKHHSQSGYKYAARIANSDKVYWVRRTDGKSYKATIIATSGDISYLNDFRLYGTDEQLAFDYTKLWYPNSDDGDKKFKMIFDKSIDIEKIVFYENVLQGNDILRATVCFSNGFEVDIQDINHDGGATTVKVPVQENIAWIEFQIKESIGEYAGLNEFEVYKPEETKLWFLKLCVEDEYVYEYYTNESYLNLKVMAYDTYGNVLDLSKEKVHIYCVNSKKAWEAPFYLNLQTISKKKIVLKAYCDEYPEIYDVITIKKGKGKLKKIYECVDVLLSFVYYGTDWLINEVYRIPILVSRILKR